MELHLNYTLLESSMVSSKAHLPEERPEHRVPWGRQGTEKSEPKETLLS